MKRFVAGLALAASLVPLAACGQNDADVASYNISKAADQFEVNRRIVFYNGITNEVLLEIDGLCSLGNDRTAAEVSITCKTGPNVFKKHFLGLSDNVTYMVQQLDDLSVSTQHYRVVWKPSTLIPDFDLR